MFCADTPLTDGTYSDARIFFCHTSRASLSSVFQDNYAGNAPVLVLNRSSLALNWIRNQWNQIAFDSPFQYDGAHNLLIEIQWSAASGAVYTGVEYPTSDLVLYGTSMDAANGSLLSYRNALRLHAEDRWDDGAQDAGNGWRWLSWFGFFAHGGGGWLYHLQHGWMYSAPTGPTSAWFWTPDMGWLWTDRGLYLWLYWLNGGTWLWYQRDSTNPRWFYNFNAGQWVARP
jgi:hypothetical protein